MDLVGGFHKVEIDGKPFLVYHNVIKPLPQIHTPNSSAKVAIDSGDALPPQSLFLCPIFRTGTLLDSLDENREPRSEVFSKFETSPLFDDTSYGHHVLPLFWCNNKEVDPEGKECYACSIQTIGTDYYFCLECDKRFHKECVELPLEISYPSHAKHSLQLCFSQYRSDCCIYCTERATYMIYYCAHCNSYMHVLCAQAKIPFFIDHVKRHEHTLTLFPRQAFLPCNICAMIDKLRLTYVCPICDFVAHSDCIYIPKTIRISRHGHRVSFISSLPFEERYCGVCRHKIDNDYGAYTCNKCSGYAVHTKCALRKDIWDEIELEEVPEEDIDVEYLEPFEMIADGTILHFSHSHHMRFETSGVYIASKFCQACVLPIYEGNFYVCIECDFILHETCAVAPRKKIHPLHPHQLQLETVHENGVFNCGGCKCRSNGFFYRCSERKCNSYQLDLRCAMVSEPFKYEGHQHPLFLALNPEEKPMCHVCKLMADRQKVLNCIDCDFIICFRCATLPYIVKYKHDEHYLTFCHGDEANDSYWCELCEGKLAIGGKTGFYKCDEYCCTTLHVHCLRGTSSYMKPCQPFTVTHKENNYQIQILRNNSASRPFCIKCDRRCPYPMFVTCDGLVTCSNACLNEYINRKSI